jgi:hypothetical protein
LCIYRLISYLTQNTAHFHSKLHSVNTMHFIKKSYETYRYISWNKWRIFGEICKTVTKSDYYPPHTHVFPSICMRIWISPTDCHKIPYVPFLLRLSRCNNFTKITVISHEDLPTYFFSISP